MTNALPSLQVDQLHLQDRVALLVLVLATREEVVQTRVQDLEVDQDHREVETNLRSGLSINDFGTYL